MTLKHLMDGEVNNCHPPPWKKPNFQGHFVWYHVGLMEKKLWSYHLEEDRKPKHGEGVGVGADE